MRLGPANAKRPGGGPAKPRDGRARGDSPDATTVLSRYIITHKCCFASSFANESSEIMRIGYGHHGRVPRTLADVTRPLRPVRGQREQLHPTTRRRIQAVPGAMVMVVDQAAKPVRAMGDFFVMSAETFVSIFRPPFAWREYLLQCWFVARVSTLPGY